MKPLFRRVNLGKVFLVAEIFFVLFFSLLNLAVYGLNGHWAWLNLMVNDGASSVVSAISHNYGLGVPYKDYWEYRPPGFIMLIDFWVKIFGFKIFSFKVLELLVRLGIGLVVCLLARKIFSPFQALVVSFLTCFVFFSPPFGTMMLADPYGLFFSLLGLLILLYVKSFNLRYLLASFFLFLSGQMKDPYFPTVLVFLPVFFYLLVSRDYRSFFKALAFTFSGFFLAFLILWVYLTLLGSWGAYVETFLFKSSNFHARFWEDLGFFLGRLYRAFRSVEDTFFLLRYSSITVLFVWSTILVFSLFFKRPFLFRIQVKNNLNFLIVIFYSIGVSIGFSLNNGFTPRYLVMMIVPVYFLWSVIISSIENSLRVIFKALKKNLIFLPATAVLLFPKFWIVSPYGDIPLANVFRQAYVNLTLPDMDTPVEKYIASKTSNDDCMVSLYGWKSPEPHLYSMRRPCSRIVQANMVNEPWQKIEYREAILNNPPAVIVYSLAGADMDVLKFEREVINFTRVINNCYKQDYKYTYNGRWSFKLYFPRISGEYLKDCVKNNATI